MLSWAQRLTQFLERNLPIWKLPTTSLVLANGANNNVNTSATSPGVGLFQVRGPTGVFSITGLGGGVGGRVIIVYNSTAFNMSIMNENASSSATNRIITTTGADVVAQAALLVYSDTANRWILIGYTVTGGGGTLTSVAGGVGITNTPEPIVGAGTVDLDINSLTTGATFALGDLIPFVDVSVGTSPASQRKLTVSDLVTFVGGSFQPLDADLTEIAAVANVRGDILITDSGSTWIRFPIGAASTVMRSNGTDPNWGLIVNANIGAAAAIDASKIASGIVSSAEFLTLDGITTGVTIQSQIDGKQALDTGLTALAGLTPAGFAATDGADGWASRTLVAPAAGITISNTTGGGNPTWALANDLLALEGLTGTGIPERIGTDNWAMISPAGNRGSLLVVNSTPLWAGFPLMGADQVLCTNAANTDPVWQKIIDANISASAAIDATKIADGTVTSAEFQFINTLTSNAQTQLNNKQPLDAGLTALAALTPAGFVATDGADGWASRTFVEGPGADVTNTTGAGNPIFSLDINNLVGGTTFAAGDLIAFVDVSIGATVAGQRNLTIGDLQTFLGGAFQPLDADLTAIAALSGIGGFATRTAANTWALRQITVNGLLSITNPLGILGDPLIDWPDNPLTISGTSIASKLTIPIGNVATQDISLALTRAGGTANFGPRIILTRARGDIGSESVVANADLIGRIQWNAFDGTDYEQAARIEGVIDDATPSGTSMGGKLSFFTTPAASVTSVLRFEISNAGRVTVSGSGFGVNGLPYVWPSSQAANQILSTNGTSTLSWTSQNLLSATHPDTNAAATPGGGDMIWFNNGTNLWDVLLNSANVGDVLVVGGASVPAWLALTGDVTLNGSTGVTTIAAQNSAFWRGKVTDETGTGLWVFNDTPTFATKIFTPRVDGGTAPGGNLILNSTTDSTIAAILLHTTATKASDDISGDICTMLEHRGALDFAGNDLLSAFFVGGDSSTSPFGRATWNITASQATLQGCNLFTFQPNITNSPSGTARSSGSWTALNNTPQFRNAGAVTHTIAEAKAINNAINLRRVTAATGNTTLTLAKGLNDAPTIGAGCTITTRYGLHFQNFTAGTGGAGVQTTAVGLQVEDQTVIDSDPGPVGSAIGFRSAMVAGVVTGTGVAPAKWHFLFTGTAPSASLGPIVVGAAAAPSHPNIALDVQSTTQVLRLTPMTTTQRDAMTTDAGSGFKHTVGMVIYNSTAATIQVCTANGAPGTWLGL